MSAEDTADPREAETIAFELGREEGLRQAGIAPPAWIAEEAARTERRRITGVLLLEAACAGVAWLVGSLIGEYVSAGLAAERSKRLAS